jgi:AcrR family transcriptional regulator
MKSYDRMSTRPDAKQRLLTVARELFARSGYDGASVRDICARAKVNLGAVTYYFGSKAVLYAAVLTELLGPIAARVQAAAQAPRPPLDRIETIVREFFEHIRRNPDMPAIMVREMASGRQIAAPVKQMMGRALPLLAGVIAEGQRDGSIRPGDPTLLALSTMAQPVYLNIARRAIATVTGIDPNDEATVARIVEHVVTTVRAALQAR